MNIGIKYPFLNYRSNNQTQRIVEKLCTLNNFQRDKRAWKEGASITAFSEEKLTREMAGIERTTDSFPIDQALKFLWLPFKFSNLTVGNSNCFARAIVDQVSLPQHWDSILPRGRTPDYKVFTEAIVHFIRSDDELNDEVFRQPRSAQGQKTWGLVNTKSTLVI